MTRRDEQLSEFATKEGQKRGLDAVYIEGKYGWLSVTDGQMERNFNFPKSGPTEEWIIKKLDEFLNIKNTYVNLSKIMEKIVGEPSMQVYPASYGVGVSNVLNTKRDEILDKIQKFLDDNGIKYNIKLSSGRFVIRVMISKAKSNLDKLNKVMKKLKL